jgi:glycosyltransferase involved in cell wall biosynthesis
MQYLGKRSSQEIEELRRRARVTVICSRYENFPMVALEAMSMGCPLVASAVGGLAEMIQDGKNGLLARPGDADDLAKRIMTMLTQPQLAQSLARQASIDCVQRYHPSAVARQMAEFYREVIGKWERQHAGSRSEKISRSAPLQPLTSAVAANKP